MATTMATATDSTKYYWFPPTSSSDTAAANAANCLCIGTGRFLRSVLVPPMVATGLCKPALIQTRGTNFLEFMKKQATSEGGSDTYPIDTVMPSGDIETVYVKCFGAFSWGSPDHQQAVQDNLLAHMKRLNIVGIGVTEAGLASPDTQVMLDLYQLLKTVQRNLQNGTWQPPDTPNEKLCLINMDNVPNNGDILYQHMMARANAEQQQQQQQSLENNDNKDNTTTTTTTTKTATTTTETMAEFITHKLCFLNTMVDRITSQREEGADASLIPKCEPIPAKALVICDPHKDLPLQFYNNLQHKYGVVIRNDPLQIEGDIALKLRVANATHTAIAHVMALVQWTNTESLATATTTTATTATVTNTSNHSNNNMVEDTTLTAKLFMSYLDALVEHQIKPSSFPGFGSHCPESQAAYDDWRPRLTHPHFGLSTFFITQNGAAKGGIRLGPTVLDLLQSNNNNNNNKPITVTMAYAFAVLLRWLTPRCDDGSTGCNNNNNNNNGVFTGWLAGTDRTAAIDKTLKNSDTISYADGLRHDLKNGWYEFRCACKVPWNTTGVADEPVALSEVLLSDFPTPRQPSAYVNVVRAYLVAPDGGNLGQVAKNPAFDTFVKAVATLYARMVAGDNLVEMLEEMAEGSGPYAMGGMATDCCALVDDADLSQGRPLFYRANPIPLSSQVLKAPVTSGDTDSVVVSEVASALVIDLHTHLLPPSHGSLCLWGIDELLTYHYLVAEYFMTAPAAMTPEKFYALNKKDQADIIWKALFIDRSPVSEACRGVITTLVALGLSKEAATRDLASIRKFYSTFRNRGLEGTEEFSELVYTKAGVQYAIMTNIPFDNNEAKYWRPERKDFSERYRSALRVDPLLAGDRATIEKALRSSGYDVTLEGARQYLRDWCDIMKPEYMMASTPHDFALQEGSLAGAKKTGVNEDAMKQPFAFVDQTSNSAACVVNCDGAEDEAPTVLAENSDFLSEVLMKICEERNLPVALKIGAHRGVNPKLLSAGDGVVAFADAGVLARLCTRFPRVLFLATFLSRNNQHEAAVLASKFRNLHLYGCWWFCNNPSIIREITLMRMEMLGTAFTSQHSDARVLDQLLYKWPHSRAVIAKVLAEEYSKLYASGWIPTRGEIRRDITRLFGGSYEEFLSKSLPAV